jgi:hypothetical protein
MDRGVYYPVPSGSIAISVPTDEDLDFLAANLRTEDAREVAESPFNPHGLPARQIFEGVKDLPGTRVVKHKGVPFMIVGVLFQGGTAFPWMLGTPAMKSFHKSIFIESKKWLGQIKQHSPVVFNYFDIRNTTHIKWALRMGFRPTKVLLNNYYLGMIL